MRTFIEALVQDLVYDQPPADNDRHVFYYALELHVFYLRLECVRPFVLFASQSGLDESWVLGRISPGFPGSHDSHEPKDHSVRMRDSAHQPTACAIWVYLQPDLALGTSFC